MILLRPLLMILMFYYRDRLLGGSAATLCVLIIEDPSPPCFVEGKHVRGSDNSEKMDKSLYILENFEKAGATKKSKVT